MVFYETSAKQNIGVMKLFEGIAKNLLENSAKNQRTKAEKVSVKTESGHKFGCCY